MNGFILKVRTFLALGLANIVRTLNYRLSINLRLNSLCRMRAVMPQGPFFLASELPNIPAPALSRWRTTAQLFSYWPITVTSVPPDWLANPFTGKRIVGFERPWWLIPDFDPAVGDIKLIWELSRMDWALAFAEQARNGDREALSRLNIWLADWCLHNPSYFGHNWKCGQEASIRVMNLAMAAMILGQAHHPTSSLRDFVQVHLQRIAPTLQYAVAQDNNHGTSEAAALFIGGSWLASLGVVEAEFWANTGRYWLENRANRLIGQQGSFSQHSLNYHRVMLDTFSIVEIWRLHFSLPAFSSLWGERALLATKWLQHMINPFNGDGPNLGANDGARLLQLTDADYRDCRPSVQLAMTLFAGTDYMGFYCTPSSCVEGNVVANNKVDFGHGFAEQPMYWKYHMQWLAIALPEKFSSQPRSLIADDGGFAILRHGTAMVMLHYPRFKFRPSQADVLHLDLWFDGENLLRDAGSYSYNTNSKWLNYFGGTASHNTIQFDDYDQMPRLSRFLFGDWLKTSFLEPLAEDTHGVSFGAGYRSRQQISHQRRISLTDSHLTVIDGIDGFKKRAVLRWRLLPGDWNLTLLNEMSCCCVAGNKINRCQINKIVVKATVPILRCEIVEGWESRYYLEKTPIPVLEIEVQHPGTVTTEYRWMV